MNSKECLERLYDNLNCEVDSYYYYIEAHKDKEKIEQDLDRLKKLENVIKILKETVDEIEFITCDEEDCYGEICLYQKINGSISIPLKTKEDYILAKEVFENER